MTPILSTWASMNPLTEMDYSFRFYGYVRDERYLFEAHDSIVNPIPLFKFSVAPADPGAYMGLEELIRKAEMQLTSPHFDGSSKPKPCVFDDEGCVSFVNSRSPYFDGPQKHQLDEPLQGVRIAGHLYNLNKGDIQAYADFVELMPVGWEFDPEVHVSTFPS